MFNDIDAEYDCEIWRRVPGGFCSSGECTSRKASGGCNSEQCWKPLQSECNRRSSDVFDQEDLSADSRDSGSGGERTAEEEHGALRKPHDGTEERTGILLYAPPGEKL